MSLACVLRRSISCRFVAFLAVLGACAGISCGVNEVGAAPLSIADGRQPSRLQPDPAFAPLRARAVAPTELAFEPNVGQADPRAKFVARSQGIDLYFTEAGAVLAMHDGQEPPSSALAPVEAERTPWLPQWPLQASLGPPSPKMVEAVALMYRFAGADAHPRIDGTQLLSGRSNYLIGPDPGTWHTDVPRYRGIRYHDVLPGVSILYYGLDGQLEFDVEVAAGVDPAQLRLFLDGAESLALDAEGNLRVRTALGDLTQRRPVVYQMIGGVRRELHGSYVLDEREHAVAFSVSDYDRDHALVLDPTLVWTSQVGGSAGDANYGVAVDADGYWYFAGYSDHSLTVNFPTTMGAYQTTNVGGYDAFVRKVGNDGSTVVYSTLIGGTGNDIAYGIGVDASGVAHIAGTTYSSNFPTQGSPPPLQATSPNGTSASGFVAALNAAGTALVYSTYLGGSAAAVPFTYINGIAVDAAGNAYVTGETTTTDLPTTATAFQPQPATTGNTSAFAFKFGPDGTRVFGTYLVDDYLGFGSDHGSKVAIDDEANVYIVGYTGSQFGGSYNGVARTLIGPGGGSTDMLVARLNHTGEWLDWVTHIGGSGTDKGTALAVNAGHQVMVAGWSASSDLPPAFVNNDDWGWIGQLDQTGTQVVDSAWIGAAGAAMFPEAIVWDELLVAGSAQKPNALAATNPVSGLDCGMQCGTNSTYGGFLALLTTGPLTLQSLTRVLGATGTDTRFHGIAQDAASATGRTAVVGGSNGTFPGTAAGDTSQGAVAAVVDTRAAANQPVEFAKRIEPATAAPGQRVKVTFIIYNPNAQPLTEASFTDYLPGCLQYEGKDEFFLSGLFYLQRNLDTGQLAMGIKQGQFVYTGDPYWLSVYARVNGTSSPCTNVTSELSTDFGTTAPVSASLAIRENPCTAVSSCTNMAMSNTACWVGSAAPTNTCNAKIAPCAGSCSITYDQPADRKVDRFSCEGSCNVAGNDMLLGGGLACDNGSTCDIGSKVRAAASTLAVTARSTPGNPIAGGPPAERATAATAAGNLTFNNGMILDGTDALFEGDATISVVSAISGSGSVALFGPGTLTIGVAPTFSGGFLVAGGMLSGEAAIAEPISISGGALRGSGPFGALHLDGTGLFFPGATSAPVTVSVGDFVIDAGRVELQFSTGNATHSVVDTAGIVPISGGTLKLDFASAPALNATFAGLINSPAGGISGCFARAIAPQPSLVLQPLCSTTAVGVKVVGNDRVLADGFEY